MRRCNLRRIAHRELRNNSSKILDDVKSGQIIEVTNHGEVVAVLIPPAATAYERLLAAGRIRISRPRRAERFSDIRAGRSERDALDVLAEMRGE
jgi:prevent-host-death family protein